MAKRVSYYWLCQFAGWSAFILIYIFFYLTLRTGKNPNFFAVLFMSAAVGFLVTHIMRLFIKRYKFVERPVNEQVIYVFFISILFSLIYAAIDTSLNQIFGIENDRLRNIGLFNKIMRNSLDDFTSILIWNLIYFTYHYIVRTR